MLLHHWLTTSLLSPLRLSLSKSKWNGWVKTFSKLNNLSYNQSIKIFLFFFYSMYPMFIFNLILRLISERSLRHSSPGYHIWLPINGLVVLATQSMNPNWQTIYVLISPNSIDELVVMTVFFIYEHQSMDYLLPYLLVCLGQLFNLDYISSLTRNFVHSQRFHFLFQLLCWWHAY